MTKIAMPSPRGTNRERLYLPSMALDEKGDIAGHEERKARREALDDHLDNTIEDDGAREKAQTLIDALVEACLPEAEGGMSQDTAERIALCVTDPNRSGLAKLFPNSKAPTYVR